VNEFTELGRWLANRSVHRIIRTESLPNPTFLRDGQPCVSFSTNNYLGLASRPRLIDAARRGLEQYGVGNCESRLLGGDMDIYRRLEAKLADLKHKQDAILFATGYLTNLGVLSALPSLARTARVHGYRPTKLYRYAYLTDEFNHISIREGIRMSGADKVTYRHCDMNHLEDKLKASQATMKIIVSDGVFSQDGDIVPLPDMLDLAEQYDAMVYIDDAHATGVLGPTGSGTTEYFNVNSPRLICMGTLSKAYGAIGGFVAADRYLTEVLRLGCSAYGFTSTLPPDQVLAISEAIEIARSEPRLRQRLWDNQRHFLGGLDELGYHVTSRQTPIVPVRIGDEDLCERCSQMLEDHGFHADSILFPAVAKGQSRLRFIMNANHTAEQIDRVLSIMGELRSWLPADYHSVAAS
jgi:glycine C-acetyltransferase